MIEASGWKQFTCAGSRTWRRRTSCSTSRSSFRQVSNGSMTYHVCSIITQHLDTMSRIYYMYYGGYRGPQRDFWFNEYLICAQGIICFGRLNPPPHPDLLSLVNVMERFCKFRRLQLKETSLIFT